MYPPPPKKGLNAVTLRGNCGVRPKHDESKHTFYTMMKQKTRHTERQFFSSGKCSFFILTVFGMFPFFHVRFSFKMKKKKKSQLKPVSESRRKLFPIRTTAQIKRLFFRVEEATATFSSVRADLLPIFWSARRVFFVSP